jgi:hypothetical protein
MIHGILSSLDFGRKLFSCAAAGGTGNFPYPGTFRTFFSIYFSSASAYWAQYRFLAVTGLTTHFLPFILYSGFSKKPPDARIVGPIPGLFKDF